MGHEYKALACSVSDQQDLLEVGIPPYVIKSSTIEACESLQLIQLTYLRSTSSFQYLDFPYKSCNLSLGTIELSTLGFCPYS